MAANDNPIFLQTPKTPPTIFDAAGGTGVQSIFTAASDGSRIAAIIVSSKDTVDRDLQLHMNDGTTSALMQTFSIPLDSGNTNAILPVDLLDTLEGVSQGDRAFVIQGNFTLDANITSTPTGDIAVTVMNAGDYNNV